MPTPLNLIGLYYKAAGQYVGPLPAEVIDRLLTAGDLPPGEAISEGWQDEGKVKFLPHGRERMRVLVVDDDEDGADSSAALVWLHGHDVQVAYDGESALRLALAYQPDVALLDLGLPGMTGFELAERLVRQSTVGKPLVVAVSGHGDRARREQWAGMRLGAYVLKPAEPAVIEKLLAVRQVFLGKTPGAGPAEPSATPDRAGDSPPP